MRSERTLDDPAPTIQTFCVSAFCIPAFLHFCISLFWFSPSLLAEVSQEARGQEPAQIARRGWRQRVDVDAADAAFLEFDRVAGADETSGELADAWLVTDQRDAAPAVVLLEIVEHRLM